MARRRQYKKAKASSKKVFSNKQKTAISKIAKKVCTTEAETKFNQRVDTVYMPSDGTFKSWNLFSTFAQGTGDNQCLGNKIHWRGIKIHWDYRLYGDSLRGWFDTPVTLTMLIVETKHYSPFGITLNDIRDDTTASQTLWFPDNETKILYKKRKIFNAVKDGDRPVFTGSIWVKRNQALLFKDFANTKQLNKKNYYFVVYAVDKAPNLDNEMSGHFFFAWKNYFKDA